jgi:hypothetical protein
MLVDENDRSVVSETRRSSYVDLGTEVELKSKYNMLAPFGCAYMSIHYQGEQLMIAEDFQWYNFQPLNLSDLVGGNLSAHRQNVTFIPAEGHIYLIRQTDTKDKEFVRDVKLLVVQYRVPKPNQATISVRWDVLRDTSNHVYQAFECFVEPNSRNTELPTVTTAFWVTISIIGLYAATGLVLVVVVISMKQVGPGVCFCSRCAQLTNLLSCLRAELCSLYLPRVNGAQGWFLSFQQHTR